MLKAQENDFEINSLELRNFHGVLIFLLVGAMIAGLAFVGRPFSPEVVPFCTLLRKKSIAKKLEPLSCLCAAFI